MKNGMHEMGESLTALLNSAPAAIIAMDPEGNVIEWNPAAERMFGWRKEEVIGRFLPIVPDDRLAEHRAFRKRAMQGEGFSDVEVLRRRKDGSLIHISISTAPVKNESDEITGIVSICIDISERKKALDEKRGCESGFSHISSLLRSLYTVQGLFADASDVQKLIEAVCGGLVKTRGYVSVWFGEPQKEPKRIIPRAHAGIAKDFTQHAPVMWDDSPLGCGPSGLAVRGKRPVVFDDLANDPRFAPWRDPVVGGGAASIASIPLIRDGEVSGVLTVKADSVRAFDAMEMELLTTLVTNLGHALDRIDQTASLRASEERYRVVVDSAGEGVWNLDAGMKTTYVSARMAEMLGYAPEEMLGRHPLDFVPPEDRPSCERELGRRYASRDYQPVELRFRRKDGAELWLMINSSLVSDETGRITGAVGLFTDITESRRREAEIRRLNTELELKIAAATDELRTSEQLYRLLVEKNSDCIWSTDEIGRLTYLSPSFFDLTGYQPEEFLGKTPFDMIPADDASRFAEMFWASIDGKLPIISFEQTIRHRDGSIVYAELNGVPEIGPDGTFLGGRGITRNITRRKRLEIELQRSERDMREILNSIPTLVGYWDKDMRCRFGNKAYSAWFGIDMNRLPGMHYRDVLGEVTFRISLPYFQAAMTGHPQSFERNTHSPDGSNIKHCLVQYIPDAVDGEIQGVYAVVSDITSVKTAEEQRRQLSKAESLNRMAGAIAHIFNNQLYVVIGNLELLMEDMALGSDSQWMLTDAMTASHKAAEVSRLMLTYLGQSSGKMEMQDLSETCHKGLLMAQAAMPKNVSLKTEMPFPGPAVNANTNQLFQIIMNLITNAWESFKDQPGTIALSVKTVSAADIPAGNRFPAGWQPENTRYVCLEVADTGCGIPKQYLGSIFDPFYSTKFSGRGLGLPVVQGILSTHGGCATVENRTEGGSAFKVFLPAASGMAPVPVGKKILAGAVQAGEMVLLVDDQDQVRNMARTMLSRMGYTDILEAADGVEAVEIFRQHQNRIRLVITDLTMPRMDGWQTLEALRKLSPGIPVILSSGYEESQVMEGSHTEQPHAFLYKPYKKRDLQEAIQKAFER